MFFYYGTRAKCEIRLIMQALEYYEAHGVQTSQRPVVHKLYEKVRAALFSSPIDARARARTGEVLNVHDLTMWQRIKFIFGAF